MSEDKQESTVKANIGGIAIAVSIAFAASVYGFTQNEIFAHFFLVSVLSLFLIVLAVIFGNIKESAVASFFAIIFLLMGIVGFLGGMEDVLQKI